MAQREYQQSSSVCYLSPKRKKTNMVHNLREERSGRIITYIYCYSLNQNKQSVTSTMWVKSTTSGYHSNWESQMTVKRAGALLRNIRICTKIHIGIRKHRNSAPGSLLCSPQSRPLPSIKTSASSQKNQRRPLRFFWTLRRHL